MFGGMVASARRNEDPTRPPRYRTAEGKLLPVPFKCWKCHADACYVDRDAWYCSVHMQDATRVRLA